MTTATATEPMTRNYWECGHPHTEIRWRTLRNGVGVWAIQCLRCGGMLRQVSKGHPDVLRLVEKRPFDEQLSDRFRDWCQSIREREWRAQEAETEQKRREWWEWYDRYLETPAWKAKRAAVLERSGGLCEGCRKRKATQIHHTTYDHVGNELLFELVAVCNACHHILHPDMDER